MLGIKPALGRTFRKDEDAPGRGHEVILNYGLWKGSFAGDPNIIGRKIRLGGQPYEVTGVLPQGFRFPKLSQLFAMNIQEERPQIWIPFALRQDELDEMGDFNFACIAHLKAGVSKGQAQTELNALQAELIKRLPYKIKLSAVLVPLQQQITGRVQTGLKLIFGAVSLLLLIACLNVASLSLARGTARKREMAIRSAIGASVGRLMRQLMVESVTLAAAGGILGVAVAYAAVRIMIANAPVDVPRIEEVGIDGRVLLFTLGISLLVGVLFGLMPAWNAAREDPQAVMKAGGRNTTAGLGLRRMRFLLVVAEVSLSAMCLVSGGLLLHSFLRLLNVDRGFQVERLITVDLALPDNKYATTESRAAVLKTLLDHIRALPDVSGSAITNKVPLTGEGQNNIVTAAGSNVPVTQQPTADIRTTDANYFRTLGIPLRSGRVFTGSDYRRPVGLVSAMTAAQLWPGQNPLGREMIIGDKSDHPIQVLGVVNDVRGANLETQPIMTIYLPYWQNSRNGMTLVVKTQASESSAVHEIRSAISQVDAELPVEHFQTMAQLVSESVAQRRFPMQLVLLFAICALLLASLGIYGVVAYSVGQRTNEIGIRMTLGAERTAIAHLVLREGLRPVVIGLFVGLLGSLALGRMLAGLLFGVTVADPLTIAAVSLLLLTVATAAVVLPTLRAVRVNPLAALRSE